MEEDFVGVWLFSTYIWEDIKKVPAFFNKQDFAKGFLFTFLLPAMDIITDFLMAQQLYENDNETIRIYFTSFTYTFIAMPGFMFS